MKTRKKTLSPIYVTVVIPVFNGASYLNKAINSVLESSFDKFEIILVDDGSSDKSKLICQTFAKQNNRIRFFSFPKNKGLGRVLNFALKKARGKYICRLNQDDIMLKNRISKQYKFLQSHNDVVAVGSCIELFFENDKTMRLKFPETDAQIRKVWHIVGPFADPSVMYNKRIALRVGGYDQKFWPADDTHLWYRMGAVGKLANIQIPLVRVRWHKNAASVKYFRKLALKTYEMHRFAHQHIQSASLLIQIYWIIQLCAGFTFSPETNWRIYRFIKKILAFDLSSFKSTSPQNRLMFRSLLNG